MTSNDPSINIDHGVNNSTRGILELVNSIEYNQLMANYISEGKETRDGLLHLRECCMANTHDNDIHGRDGGEHSTMCAPSQGYNKVDPTYKTSR